MVKRALRGGQGCRGIDRLRVPGSAWGWTAWSGAGIMLVVGAVLAWMPAHAAEPARQAELEATGYYDKFGGLLAVIVKPKDAKLNVKPDFAMPTKRLPLDQVDGLVKDMKKEDVDHGGVSGVSAYSIERGQPVNIVTSHSGVQVQVSDPGNRGGTGGGGSGGSGGGGGASGGGGRG